MQAQYSTQLIYHIATSLDGFIAHADHTHGGLLMQGDHAEAFVASLSDYGSVIMGRHTYDIGFAHGVRDPYPFLRTLVASRTLPTELHDNVEVVRDGLLSRVRALKAQAEKPIWLCGGGELAGQLFEAGLIDEVHIKLNPALIGAGIGLTSGLGQTVGLTLLSQQAYESGVVLLRYAVASRTTSA